MEELKMLDGDDEEEDGGEGDEGEEGSYDTGGPGGGPGGGGGGGAHPPKGPSNQEPEDGSEAAGEEEPSHPHPHPHPHRGAGGAHPFAGAGFLAALEEKKRALRATNPGTPIRLACTPVCCLSPT